MSTLKLLRFSPSAPACVCTATTALSVVLGVDIGAALDEVESAELDDDHDEELTRVDEGVALDELDGVGSGVEDEDEDGATQVELELEVVVVVVDDGDGGEYVDEGVGCWVVVVVGPVP